MKTVLVTGAAGFIGSHVAEHLLARGDNTAFSRFLLAYLAISRDP